MKRILNNEAVESAGGKQRRNAIVTGDSFTDTLNMFLAAHFRKTLKIRPLIPYKDPFFRALSRWRSQMFTLTLWSTYISPILPGEFFSGKSFRALIWQLADLCSVAMFG